VAPEVMSGAGYGKSCDIWSAGVVLYILLCGFLPFDAAEPGSREKLALPAFAADVDFPKPYWDHMSDASKDLVRRMLVMDPKARITTAKVLQHNWIEMCRQGTLPQLLMPQMQQRLKDNVMTRKLMGAINSLAALRNMQLVEVDWDRVHCLMREKAVDCLSKIKLDPTREAELREGFDLLDRDNSGKISLSNLEDSMRALGHVRSKEEVEFMMNRFDLYQTGDISFEEYCVMMSVPPDFLQNNWAPEPMMAENEYDRASRPRNPDERGTEHRIRSSSEESPVKRGLQIDLPPFPQRGGTDPWERRCSDAHDLTALGKSQLLDEYRSDLQKKELMESFKVFDIDNSGAIDPQNIKEVLSRLGSTLTDEEAVKMVEIADYKQNGVIEFDEFVALVTSQVTSQGAAGEDSVSQAQSPSMAAASSAARPPVLLSDEVEEAFSDSGWREKPRDCTLRSSRSPVRSPAVSSPATTPKVSSSVTLPSVPELGAPVFLSDEVEKRRES
jgi:Ca2+-binding EF-hand superfamily protein